MSPDHRDYDDSDEQYGLEQQSRSIFAALWFRVILVVAVIGVIAAVAVPYVLEWMNPPPPQSVAVKPATPTPPAPTAPTAPATPTPAPAVTAPARKEPPGVAAVAPPAATPTAPPVAARPPAPASEEKPAPAAKSAAKVAAPRTAKAVAKPPAATAGAYFVQVGAFREADHARKLAAKLRGDKFRVAESASDVGGEKSAAPAATAPAPAAAGGDKYDVFVTGAASAELNAKLAAKGLTTAPTPNGVVVKPSLPLREAVALSKDLAVDGLKVQVRRAAPAGAAAAPAREPAPPAASAGDGLHRVMVGPFADRAAATEALQALRGKGYRDSFIARGGA
jgi:cell division septation protein DedD